MNNAKNSNILMLGESGEIVFPEIGELSNILDIKDHLKEMAKWLKMYAGFTPDEGETLNGEVMYQRTHVDRAATLELGLFTNVSPTETITEATITEPTGTGYARIVLADASWSVTGGVASYAQQTFTGGAGGWAGSIQGYFIASVGVVQRLLVVEIDASGPYTISENDTYKITPQITYT